MWEFYLAGCKAAFRHGGLVNFQVQLSRRVDTVPLTRDYSRIDRPAPDSRSRRPGRKTLAV
jgi:cyclopropane-fatty-acyl-phospholipid synthase